MPGVLMSAWNQTAGSRWMAVTLEFHGDGFPFPANPYNRCLAEAALSYMPEGDPMVLRI